MGAKLDKLIQEYTKKTNLLSEQMPPGDPSMAAGAPPMDPAMAGGPPMGMPMAPMAPPPERKELTSPGREFLIELVRKALAISPEELNEHEKGIFEKDVNTDTEHGSVYTADDLLDELNDIIEAHSVGGVE